jgi:4-amino-4-deoxy-L-arabinose transferase-like glycosyltransferase
MAAVFSVLGTLLVALIARRMYDRRAAFAALVVWSCCPMILGHGASVNHDVPGAALLAGAFLAFLVFREAPQGGTAAVFGLVSGLALLTRTTCAPVIGVWLVVHALCASAADPSQTWRRRVVQSLGIAGLALFVLNAGYGFSGTLTKLGDYTFFSAALSGRPADAPGGNRFRETWWAEFPVPLPKDYVQGLDLQQRDFEAPPFESYLLGEWHPRGWWYYYLVGWAVKTPVGFQVMLVAGIATWLYWRSPIGTRESELWALGSAWLVFALASMQCGFTIHYRYVLPAWPFLAVISGRVFSVAWRRRHVIALASLALALGVAESLNASPHHIAFFNAWVGGARRGPDLLLHSSCDWGQEVYQAVDWYQTATADDDDRDVYVLPYGAVTPEMLGVTTPRILPRAADTHHRRPTEVEIRPGLYAVSVAHLYGRDSPYDYFLRLEPVGWVSTTMPIYRLSAPDIERLELNRPMTEENR